MYFVKGVQVANKIVEVSRRVLEIYLSLFAKHEVTVIEQVVEPYRWCLVLLDREGSMIPLTTGSVIRIRRPLVGSRICPGETLVSMTKSPEENALFLSRTVIPCTNETVNGFCPIHASSEYSRYLAYVYGLSEFPPNVGLATVPHMVYMLYLGGSEAKVGVANVLKNVNRLFEQVFVFAMLITFVGNASEARNAERTLSRAGLRERATVAERIKYIRSITGDSLDNLLKNFLAIFLRLVKPSLEQLKICSAKNYIPILRFSNRCFDVLRSSSAISSKKHLNTIEGEAVIEDYCLGGLIIDTKNARFYIPYQLIRDRALNIDIIR